MLGQADIHMEEQFQEDKKNKVVDEKDLAALWAIGVLVSLILSLVAFSWDPSVYEARQSTSLDSTEARVENSQNQLVADALNNREIEYHSSMEKLVKLRPALIRFSTDLFRLLLFPTVPITIIVLLIRKSILYSKEKKSG